MTPEDEMFEKVSDRISQAKGDCALLLIDRIVEALRAADVPIDEMSELCRSVVSGQMNDPAADYALADFTNDYANAMAVKKATMLMMIEDAKHDQQSSGAG